MDGNSVDHLFAGVAPERWLAGQCAGRGELRYLPVLEVGRIKRAIGIVADGTWVAQRAPGQLDPLNAERLTGLYVVMESPWPEVESRLGAAFEAHGAPARAAAMFPAYELIHSALTSGVDYWARLALGWLEHLELREPVLSDVRAVVDAPWAEAETQDAARLRLSRLLQRVRRIEEVSLNAWPGLKSIICDGWIIRSAGGYTKRANSVVPLYPGRLDVSAKLAEAEHFYAAASQRTIFKLTDEAEPRGLDAVLESTGYERLPGARVLTIDLDASAPIAPDRAIFPADAPSAEWVEAYATFSGLSPEQRQALTGILNAIPTRARYAAVVERGQIVSVALGVHEAEYVGIFDVVTHPEHRRRGFAGRAVRHLIEFGLGHGARHAYLQVAVGNTAAEALYAHMGFTQAYAYWYRIK